MDANAASSNLREQQAGTLNQPSQTRIHEGIADNSACLSDATHAHGKIDIALSTSAE